MREVLTRSVTGALFVVSVVTLLWLAPDWFPLFLILVSVIAFMEVYRMFQGVITWFGIAASAGVLCSAFYPMHLQLFLGVYAASLVLLTVVNKHFIPVAVALCFLIALPVTLMNLCLQHSEISKSKMLLAFFIVVWTNDTMAYLGGKIFGRSKLAPSISPGKTIEGSIIGIAFGTTVVLLLKGWFNLSIAHMLILSFVTCVSAISGDLLESAIKRLAGVKDSGHILPGHGGVLDRFDAAFGAFPITLLTYIILTNQ